MVGDKRRHSRCVQQSSTPHSLMSPSSSAAQDNSSSRPACKGMRDGVQVSACFHLSPEGWTVKCGGLKFLLGMVGRRPDLPCNAHNVMKCLTARATIAYSVREKPNCLSPLLDGLLYQLLLLVIQDFRGSWNNERTQSPPGCRVPWTV